MDTISDTQKSQHAVVIGGGIVGICCALSLLHEGFEVTLIDPARPGDSTAKWSCGQLSVGEIIPLSKPGILTKIPGWMVDQTGPLALRPKALPSLMPWFFRFLGNSRRTRIEDIAGSMASLTHHVFNEYKNLLDEETFNQLIVNRPVLQVFDSQKGVEGEQGHNQLRRKLGFESRVLSGEDIADLEPELKGKFTHGILLPQWRFVADTEVFLVSLTEKFISEGGKRIEATAKQFLEKDHVASAVILDSGENISADYFVLAAGIGARRFFKQLNMNVPLQPVAGYQVVVKDSGLKLNHSVIYGDGGFCFTPMTRGIQIGGTIEFTGDSLQPNFKRAELILQKAKKIFPELNTTNIESGIGYRPLLPDTKPIIDRSQKYNNILLAIGHGQLGLTLGAITGRLITDLAMGRKPAVDLSPFSATRF